jgi:serine/threonine-protein kinase
LSGDASGNSSAGGRPPLTPERWRQVEELIEWALELDSAGRAALLDRECGGDPELRAEVEELLAADASAPAFLDQDAVAFAAPAWRDADERADSGAEGERVGPYRLLREIGRGGSSRVFAAERVDDHLHRRVALKRFAAGGWLRDELRDRFRAEGRALATLSHPHIAQVYDAGVDEVGDPYLAIELIDGIPITELCATRRLDLERRLELLLEVCAAVRHAHQHLIVHRDLKPSNILVDRDGRVKLLDFGIAKLLDPAPSDPAAPPAATRTGLLPMTPEYAAPEQVRGETITTATDVYALGLLLFELLTGRRARRIDGRTPADIERAICDVELARPSTVVTAPAADGAASAAAMSKGDLRRLRRRLAGDLDTVVLKAVALDPSDRYSSVEALADDLRRFLAGRPIAARPPRLAYRMHKFVRRHRLGVALGVATLATAIGFGVVIVAGQREAERQRDLARLESEKAGEITQLLLGLFEASDPSATLGEETTARQLLERGAARVEEMADRPAVQQRMLDVLGTVFGHLGNYQQAEEMLRRALDFAAAGGRGRTVEAAAIVDHLAAVRMQQSAYADAEALFRDALAIREERLGREHPDVASSLSNLAVALKERGEPRAAEPLLRRALAILERCDEACGFQAAETALNLGVLLHDLERYDESEPALRSARASFERREGPIHPRIADASNALGNLLSRRGRFDEAEPLLREALDQRLKIYGADHSAVAQSRNDLAVLLENRGAFEQAAPVYRAALASYERLLGPEHLAVAIAASNLAGVEGLCGRFDEAEALYRRSLAVVERQLGPVNRYAPRRIAGIGMAQHGRGELAAAERSYRRALAMANELYGADSPSVAFVQLELGRLLVESGRADEAAPVLRAAHDVYLETLGERHARSARAAMWRGAALVARGERATGARLLEAALAVQRALLPPAHPHLVETERTLAALGSTASR